MPPKLPIGERLTTDTARGWVALQPGVFGKSKLPDTPPPPIKEGNSSGLERVWENVWRRNRARNLGHLTFVCA